MTAYTRSREIAAALRRQRYRAGAPLPIHGFERGREALPEPLFFGGQWGDIPLRANPSAWFAG